MRDSGHHYGYRKNHPELEKKFEKPRFWGFQHITFRFFTSVIFYSPTSRLIAQF